MYGELTVSNLTLSVMHLLTTLNAKVVLKDGYTKLFVKHFKQIVPRPLDTEVLMVKSI